MSTVQRRRTAKGIEIYNSATKRWVKETGVTAKPIIRDAVATTYGNPNVKAKAPYDQYRSATWKGWTKLVNDREEPTSVTKMVNSILAEKKPGRDNLFVDLRYLDVNGHSIIKSVKLAGHTKNTLFDTIIGMTSVNTRQGGSDEVDDTHELDTMFFATKFKSTSGGKGSNQFTVQKTELFKTHSFKCEEGDCLLAILRNDKTRFETIRKEIGLKKGLIKISDIPKIEDYFEVNINILDDSINILKKHTKDTYEKNRTDVDWEYSYKFKSEERYRSDYEILLKDEHYSLIVHKYEVKFDPTCGERISKADKLTCEQIQKSLTRQNRKIANKAEEVIRAVKYIFFDIETIFDPKCQNYLAPYSIAWWVCDATTNPPNFTKKNLDQHLNNTKLVIGNDCIKQFVKWIEKNDKDTKFILIGFNNSRFDNFPLLNEVIDSDIFTHMLFVQNSVLKLEFGNKHVTFDLCRFVMSSLKAACDSFNVYPKKLDGFSHFAPQDAFMEGGWDKLFEWTDDNLELLSLYNKTDVLATANLFFIVRQAYAKMTNVDILEYTTLASLSFDCFRNSISEVKDKKRIWKYDISAPPTHELDKYIRKGATGGRNQKFKHQPKINDTVMCVDVKSLYPYVMLNRNFPCGEMNYTETYRKDKLGMYNVRIKKQPEVKIIAMRGEESLDWDYNGEIVTILTSIEINCLERHGADYEIIPLDEETESVGFYWEDYSDQIFNVFFENIKNEKTRQDILAAEKAPAYNPALRNICKLILNSLSGKPLQRNFDTTTEMVKNEKEETKFTEKIEENGVELVLQFSNYALLSGKKKEELIYNPKVAKPSYLTAFIYAHARSYMYDLLYSQYNVVYTDTDSGVLTEEDYNDFASKKIKRFGKAPNYYYQLSSSGTKTIGGEFGQFEEEFDSQNKECESYFIAKKVYAVEIREDGKLTKKSKYRMKGINLGTDPNRSSWDCIITKEQAKMIEDLDPSEETNRYLYNLFKKSLEKKKDFMEPFRQLSKNGECYFFCSKLNKSNLHIAQSFSVKHLSIEEL